jgi:hypothetical protein
LAQEVILYAAQGGALRDRRRFQPRHFSMLVRGLAPDQVRWARGLGELPQGGWALVIHAPGSYSLNRELAERHAGGRSVFDRLSGKELRALEDRDGVLLLDLDWDPLIPDEDVVTGLIASIERLGLPTSRIRVLHANQAAQAPFEALWRKHTTLEPCRTLEFPTSLALGVVYQHARARHAGLEARLAAAKARLSCRELERKFNLFNGGLRPHRLHVLAFLHREGLLDEGYVSMLGYRKHPRGTLRLRAGQTDELPAELRRASAKIAHPDALDASLEAVWRMMPLTLDLKHDFRLLGYERMVWSSQDPGYYDKSWFSVVTESFVTRPDVLHVTEKVMKPLMNAHPFLYLGGPGGLAQLRTYGFETFAPSFDEAYDVADGPRKRIRMFLAELARLAAAPQAELREMCTELWPRCEHNYHHLWDGAFDRLAEDFRTQVLQQLC